MDEPNFDKILSCVFIGGLGNELFQIAAILHSTNGKKNVFPLFGFWKATGIKGLYYKAGDLKPWGGHSLKNYIGLDEVFPKLPFSDKKKYSKLPINKKWIENEEGDNIYIPLKCPPPCRVFGYFFNYRYWHKSREHIMDMLQFSPKIIKKINKKYSEQFKFRCTSIHLRLGHESDSFQPTDVPIDMYKDVFKKTRSKFYFIFTDNVSLYKKKMLPLFKKMIKSRKDQPKLILVDADVYIVIAMMAMCYHHVLGNSTLSFWGLYLSKYADKGKTFLNKDYFLKGWKVFPPKWAKSKNTLIY